MWRSQVVGQRGSRISNRTNEFRDVVTRSTPEPDTKHMLHVTNRLSAWFARHEIKMNDTGEIVPDVRCLARSIMRHGASDSAVRCLSAPCSSRRPQSSPTWCASPAGEGRPAPNPVRKVPPPTRDCPIPPSMEKHPPWPGCPFRPERQIWCLLYQFDHAL